MNWLKRFLKEEYVDLDFGSGVELPEEEPLTGKDLQAHKEQLLERMVDLFERSGKVANRRKLLVDLVNRERKATTALGQGVAIPHVRTKQAREFAMAIGIAPEGLPFEAPDDEPVRLFVGMVAPPYDDKTYLKVYQNLGEVLQHPDIVEQIIEASSEGEAIRFLTQFG